MGSSTIRSCCLLWCLGVAASIPDDTLALIQAAASVHLQHEADPPKEPANWTGCIGFQKSAPMAAMTECPNAIDFNAEHEEVGQRRRVKCLKKMLPGIEAKMCDLCKSMQCNTNHKEMFSRIKDKIVSGEKFIVDLLSQTASLHKTLPNEMTEFRKTFTTWDVAPPFGLDVAELGALFPRLELHLRDIADLNDNQRVGEQELKAFLEAGSVFSESQPVVHAGSEPTILTEAVRPGALNFRSTGRSAGGAATGEGARRGKHGRKHGQKQKHRHKHGGRKREQQASPEAAQDKMAASFAKTVGQMKNATTNFARAWLAFDAAARMSPGQQQQQQQ